MAAANYYKYVFHKHFYSENEDSNTFKCYLFTEQAQFVILASDGLWDVLSNEYAVAYIRAHLSDSDHGAKSLVQHAYNLGSQDNITAAVINFDKLKSSHKS